MLVLPPHCSQLERSNALRVAVLKRPMMQAPATALLYI
jgi:hypothetical protein